MEVQRISCLLRGKRETLGFFLQKEYFQLPIWYCQSPPPSRKKKRESHNNKQKIPVQLLFFFNGIVGEYNEESQLETKRFLLHRNK